MNDKVKQFRLLNMVEEIEDYAILLLDVNGHIENWNKGAEKIKGYKANEVIGKHFRLFYTENDKENKKPESLIEIATIKGKAYDEGWRVRKDKSRFWGSILITPIYSADREIIGFTKVTRDLTEKMLAAETVSQHLNELQLKNKELEQFVYIASHDLQEPLLTVINFIDLLKSEYGHLHEGDAVTYIDFIEQAAERMRNLVKDLLDYSRIGKVKGTAQVDVNDLLGDITNDIDNLIEASHAQINYQNLPTVKGYATELRQLFQNLIINAIKFAKKGVPPIITITAVPYKLGWKFTVQDNGIGIDPQHTEKIFLIFQRLHTRDEYPGSGIGLANCKKIVVMHNGDIGVESVPGVGSAFKFTIDL